jgi:hypothetical protein
MITEESDEVFYEEKPDKSEEDELYEDDCRERARDMQEELKRIC